MAVTNRLSAVASLEAAIMRDGYYFDIMVKGKDKRNYDGGLNKDDIINISEDGILYIDPSDMSTLVYVPMSRIDHISVSNAFTNAEREVALAPMDFGRLVNEAEAAKAAESGEGAI